MKTTPMSIGKATLVMSGSLAFLAMTYQVLQFVYREHCTRNLLNAVLFANSDACIYTNNLMTGIETACNYLLRTTIASVTVWVYATGQRVLTPQTKDLILEPLQGHRDQQQQQQLNATNRHSFKRHAALPPPHFLQSRKKIRSGAAELLPPTQHLSSFRRLVLT